MLAAYAARFDDADPLNALEVADRPDPVIADGWVDVRVRASSLNQHDLWSLRGVGLTSEQLPMILGCDASGVDAEGNEVLIYPVIADATAGRGDETQDPKRTLLSEKHPGTLAERVAVPSRCVVPKPAELSFVEAACLPTAWLTAYRMLTTKAQVGADTAVLVQGAGGGVSTAAVVLAHAMGARVYVTSRDAGKRERVEALGVTALEPGVRLPERVDVVIESVGEATLEHSLRSLRPGGTVVMCGATSGHLPRIDLRRVFFLQLSIVGSTMGTRDELVALLDIMVRTGTRPVIDRVLPFADVRDAFAHLLEGTIFGKVVLDHTA